jgi:hypothetical protein
MEKLLPVRINDSRDGETVGKAERNRNKQRDMHMPRLGTAYQWSTRKLRYTLKIM